MRRDLSKFDHVNPPDTLAKSLMIENSLAPSDQIIDWLIEEYPSELITKTRLQTAVILAALDLGFEKILREPSTICRMIWRKLKSLRPDDAKHGARYKVDDKQTEVRAVRRRSYWMAQDQQRKVELFDQELAKGAKESNMGG